jgi:hypothetical protein
MKSSLFIIGRVEVIYYMVLSQLIRNKIKYNKPTTTITYTMYLAEPE